MTIHARVLGIAQDAGVPHIGCSCPRCERFRDDPLLPASLGLLGERRYLIDATPAMAEQIRMLGGLPDAILLTHLHMGHVAGLLLLGKEALDHETEIHASPAICEFLLSNRPWQQLPMRLHPMRGPVELEPGLSVEPIAVPHRGENADTVAFLVKGPEKTLLYLPDVDHWGPDLADLLSRCDIALLDGTFYSGDELSRQEEVPHPAIAATLDRLAPEDAAKVRFTHFNHTNPVLDEGGPNVLAAVQGETIELG